jgi:hypothetical protein
MNEDKCIHGIQGDCSYCYSEAKRAKELELATLKNLVIDLEEVVREVANNYYKAIDDKFYCPECHAEKGKEHLKSNCLIRIAQEILSRPEVKAISEERP